MEHLGGFLAVAFGPETAFYKFVENWLSCGYAKNPAKGYGCPGDYKNSWVWYERWLATTPDGIWLTWQ